MAQYNKNIVFGSDVDNVPISIQIEASNFEDLIEMIEIAANVEFSQIGKNNYTVKTFSEAQKIRDTQNAEKDRAALAEKTMRELESEKQRTFNDTLNRLRGTEVRLFDVKFVAVDDLEKAIQEVLGDDFKDVVRIKSLSVGGERNYSSILVSAPSQQILERVGDLIRSIDREKPMVEIEALFVEVTMNNQDELGLEWGILPNAMEYQEVPILNSAMGDIFNGRTFGRMVRTSGASVSAQLRQLAESGKGRVLSNTKVRAMSGRKSYFTTETQ
jgi:type II secretory pathway component GspD/PulD (secretin)